MERLALNPRGLEYETFFSEYASTLTSREARTFKIIRGFTESVLFEYNNKALRLLQDNPSLKGTIKGVAALRDHLTIWLAKYNAVFIQDPTMALLYVGVDEKVPYPRYVEQKIWNYLKSKGEVGSLLRSEKSPVTRVREEVDEDIYWYGIQLNRWSEKEIRDVKTKVAALEGAAVPEELDFQLASVIAEFWYPGCELLKTDVPTDEIVVIVSQISELQIHPPLTGDQGIVDQVRAALKTASGHPDLQFMALLPLIPRLVRSTIVLKTNTKLKDLWEEARPKLIDWGERYLSTFKEKMG
jgi:hypothetical protein